MNKGFNETHYFISLSNRSKIHFYRPNENHEWQRKGNSTSLCFQREPCEDPSKIIESWTSEILKIGGNAKGIPKLANFGSEQWMLDPEGNLVTTDGRAKVSEYFRSSGESDSGGCALQ